MELNPYARAVSTVALAATAFFTVAAFATLPADAVLAIHWNIDGVADGFAGREALLIVPVVTALVGGLLVLAVRYDPRRANIARSADALGIVVVALSLLVAVVQSAIIVLLAMATGARFQSLPGVAVLILVAAMVGAAFGAISYAIALLARREETVIAVMNFTLLPLTFLSAGFMQKNLMPEWMQRVADFNPVNWAVEAGRVAAAGGDWGFVGLRVALLAGFLVLGLAASTSAFRAYQRSA